MRKVKKSHSVSDFNRDSQSHFDRLRQTGDPELLTIDGKPAFVVQDAQAYQRLLEAVDMSDSCADIRESLQRMRSGDDGADAFEFLDRLGASMGLDFKRDRS